MYDRIEYGTTINNNNNDNNGKTRTAEQVHIYYGLRTVAHTTNQRRHTRSAG